MSLEQNLYSKRDLRFRADGTFRILMLSDIQETLEYDPKTLRDMDRLIEREQPDLVLLGGDICNGLVLRTEEELKAYLDIFTEPMEKRGIPWAHVFGNHDHDIEEMSGAEKARLYETYAHCVSKHTQGIYGTTNFMLPVKSSQGDRIAFAVWGLDTNNIIQDAGIDALDDLESFVRPNVLGRWDVLHFDQLMWYWNSSCELEKHSGCKVNGLMFMHIAPWEFQFVVDNMEKTGGRGSTVEQMNLGMFNSGLFSAVLQRGDIRCIACGHSHEDCFDGTLCGIKLCLDACAGYSPYGRDELRGGRVFVLNEKNTAEIETHMVHYRDLL